MTLSGSQGAKLRATRAVIEARQKGLQAALATWLTRMARIYAREGVADIDALLGRQIIKAADNGPVDEHGNLRSDLIALLRRYGIRTAADAANGTAGEVIYKPNMVADAMAGKPVKIKWFWEYDQGVIARADDVMRSTKTDVREYVRSLVTGAMNESPQPSVGEVARRIRNTLYSGAPDKTSEQGRVFTFSSERAAIIARTEIAQAHAAGQAEGYYATSDDNDELEWLAYAGGGRGHEKMSGERITIADSKSSDSSRWFHLPSGNDLRYPCDVNAPIGDTINCRCDVRKISAKVR